MVRGIGGIFIYADNPTAMVEWYKTHFGIVFQFEASERSFYKDFLLPIDPDYGRTEREVFAIRQAEPKGFQIRQRFVINLRVHGLNVLLERLRSSGVIVDRVEDFDYGHFARLKDLEGNELELFEPSEL
jgi:predicted enzyme related to lactoylglutathione lyase